MTKLLDRAVDAVRQLDPESQDEIARAIMSLAAAKREPEPIDPAHIPALLEALEQARRGEFASDEQVEEVFRRFGR